MHCCILARIDCCCSWGVCGGAGAPPTKGCMAGLAAGLRLPGGMMPMGGRTPRPPEGCAMAGSPLLAGPGSIGEACEGGPIDCPGNCCAAAAAIVADACNCESISHCTRPSGLKGGVGGGGGGGRGIWQSFSVEDATSDC